MTPLKSLFKHLVLVGYENRTRLILLTIQILYIYYIIQVRLLQQLSYTLTNNYYYYHCCMLVTCTVCFKMNTSIYYLFCLGCQFEKFILSKTFLNDLYHEKVAIGLHKSFLYPKQFIEPRQHTNFAKKIFAVLCQLIRHFVAEKWQFSVFYKPVSKTFMSQVAIILILPAAINC